MRDVLVQITFCPSCGSENIRKVRRNWTGNFRGEVYTVPLLEFYQCLDCGERIYDRQAMRKIENFSPAFAKHNVEKVGGSITICMGTVCD